MTTKITDLFPQLNSNENIQLNNINPKIDYSPNQNVSSILKKIDNNDNNIYESEKKNKTTNDSEKKKSNNSIYNKFFLLDGLLVAVISYITFTEYFVNLQNLLLKNFNSNISLYRILNSLIIGIIFILTKLSIKYFS